MRKEKSDNVPTSPVPLVPETEVQQTQVTPSTKRWESRPLEACPEEFDNVIKTDRLKRFDEKVRAYIASAKFTTTTPSTVISSLFTEEGSGRTFLVGDELFLTSMSQGDALFGSGNASISFYGTSAAIQGVLDVFNINASQCGLIESVSSGVAVEPTTYEVSNDFISSASLLLDPDIFIATAIESPDCLMGVYLSIKPGYEDQARAFFDQMFSGMTMAQFTGVEEEVKEP